MALCLYLIYTDNIDEKILNTVFSKLPLKKQKEILNFKFSYNHVPKILSKYLLYKIISYELEIDICKVNIEYGNKGKPFLKNGKRCFSISYSKEIIVIATDIDDIGVDIEYIKPISEYRDMLDFFMDSEKSLLLKSKGKDRLEKFYELWTLKESYLKALGLGLEYPLNKFGFDIAEERAFLSQAIDNESKWNFMRYSFYQKYKCAICSKQKKFPKEPIIITENDLQKF